MQDQFGIVPPQEIRQQFLSSTIRASQLVRLEERDNVFDQEIAIPGAFVPVQEREDFQFPTEKHACPRL
jgi:hypothetical protein